MYEYFSLLTCSRYCDVGCCGRMRNAVKTFIDSSHYQHAVLTAILVNTLSMGIEYHNQVIYSSEMYLSFPINL